MNLPQGLVPLLGFAVMFSMFGIFLAAVRKRLFAAISFLVTAFLFVGASYKAEQSLSELVAVAFVALFIVALVAVYACLQSYRRVSG